MSWIWACPKVICWTPTTCVCWVGGILNHEIGLGLGWIGVPIPKNGPTLQVSELFYVFQIDGIPSSKLRVCYGKAVCFIGKPSIKGPVSSIPQTLCHWRLSRPVVNSIYCWDVIRISVLISPFYFSK